MGFNYSQSVHRNRLRSFEAEFEFTDLEVVDANNFTPDPMTFDHLQSSLFDPTLKQNLLPPKNKDLPKSEADQGTTIVFLCVSRRAAPAAYVVQPEPSPHADQSENVIETRKQPYEQLTLLQCSGRNWQQFAPTR